ncbi:MAG TPA: hypothetical protein VLX44_08255 [Xanthobacteraceae bacterium]|nr:hypothetical protein [Xanthobacteraceae bacterium]
MVEFGRRAPAPIGPIAPNADKKTGPRLLCVAGTVSQKAFPQNFRFPLPRACAVVCDDIERFGALMQVHREWVVPSHDDLRQLGDVLWVQWLFIVSKTHFPGPYAPPPPIVGSCIGQSGLFIRDHLHDKTHEGPDLMNTAFSCYVLLNDKDEARLYDRFEDYMFAGPFAAAPIVAFGFHADRFVLPMRRRVDESKPFESYERFVPTDEIVIGVY